MAKLLFIDLETTGTDIEKGHSIWSLSGLLEINGKIVETFDFKMKPMKGTVYDPKALELNNITIEDLEAFPPQAEIFKQFIEILDAHISKFDKKDKAVLVGYNVQFDEKFLYQWCLDNQFTFLRSYIFHNALDVMDLCHFALLPMRDELPNLKLTTMSTIFSIDHTAHESMSDIKVTYELFKDLRETLGFYPIN